MFWRELVVKDKNAILHLVRKYRMYFPEEAKEHVNSQFNVLKNLKHPNILSFGELVFTEKGKCLLKSEYFESKHQSCL